MVNLKSSAIKKVIFVTVSIFIGFIFGTIFKTPNGKLIFSSKMEKSEWKSQKLIEMIRSSESFFSFQSFDFNLFVGIFAFSITLFITLFFGDNSFRELLYKKILFLEERAKYKKEN